jgi:glycosyltransferase involved in cell wall biosynthesis
MQGKYSGVLIYLRPHMRPGEPILLICHSFPPNYGIGGRRWAKFAKELARRGHPVHVIHSAGTPRDHASLWTDDVLHANIIAHPLPNRYPIVLTRWPVTALKDKLLYAFWLKVLPLFTRGNWFDRGIFWRKPLLHTAGKLIREHGIHNVIATGAPFSLLAYAAELKQQFPDIHLVSDLRDMWTGGRSYGYQTIGEKRLRHEQQLEAMVAQVSDMLVSPHPVVLDYLGRAYGVPAEHMKILPHAIDPEDLGEPVKKADNGMFRMIYAGSLYDAREAQRYFELLLQAFEHVRDTRPEQLASCRLDLYITDHGTRAFEDRVKERGLQDVIHFHDPLPPREVLQQIAQADLVLAYHPQDKKDVMVTKFTEVAYLGRPILHIGDPGSASRTILEQRMGDSIRLEELVTELPRIIQGERKVSSDSQADRQAPLLGHVTDILVKEVLV